MPVVYGETHLNSNKNKSHDFFLLILSFLPGVCGLFWGDYSKPQLFWKFVSPCPIEGSAFHNPSPHYHNVIHTSLPSLPTG